MDGQVEHPSYTKGREKYICTSDELISFTLSDLIFGWKAFHFKLMPHAVTFVVFHFPAMMKMMQD